MPIKVRETSTKCQSFRIKIVAMQPGYRKKETDIFVCDSCGARKRLDSRKRHWCDNCTRGAPVEMRRARDKRLNQR
jgi:hypothetical protein